MAQPSPLHIRIESRDFACGDLRVRRMVGREAISELFTFDLDLAHAGPHGLPPEAVPGAEVTLVLEHEDGEERRRIHGIIGQIRDRLDASREHRAYRMRVVPRAARLTLVQTQEIFMDQSVPEIIKGKLEQVGLSGGGLDMRLTGSYPAREFVVQYKESDLAFISRLAEHLGLSFFFEHSDSEERIVFADNRSAYGHIEGGRIAYRGRGEAAGVFELEIERELLPRMYAMQDYNYRHPLADLWASHTLEAGTGGGVVEYGAHYKTSEEGAALARIRAEERLAQDRIHEGKSDIPGVSAGTTAKLEGHPLIDAIDLLFVEVTHDLTIAEQGSGRAAYTNTFRAVPAENTYRPPRRTPRPKIAGFVTGIVQARTGGARGSTPALDEFGRYVVQFHFDTAPGERAASRPVRMAQPYIGPNHGMHFPLRPGAEVLIGFMDGDPDRPVILGAVPNAIAPSPVTSASANKSRISTANAGILIELADGK
jgi:type VI secretion system secreted protein VgrG